MIYRLIAATALGLTLCGPATAGSPSSQGELLCHQDVAKVARYAEQKRPTLTPAQQRSVADRLHVADNQCRSMPALASSNLNMLRRDLERDQIQSAQTPDSYGSGGYQ